MLQTRGLHFRGVCVEHPTLQLFTRLSREFFIDSPQTFEFVLPKFLQV
jgi:hypothetical protein